MTDEIDRSIRDEVMTLESNGSLWVLAEDYRALLARAEAAEADHRQSIAKVYSEHARAEAAEAKLAAARGGVAAIAAERQRQMDVEGWSPAYDDTHVNGEMAGAAACYALAGVPHWAREQAIASFWPWAGEWWKPSGAHDDLTARRRDLVKAGALIAAEIDRLDRAALRALAGERKDG